MTALKKLARTHGAFSSYWGVGGKLVEAEPEALLAVLRVLGSPIERVADADDALRERRLELSRRMLPEAAVLWGDGGARVPVNLPPGTKGSVRLDLALEEGGAAPLERRLDALPARRRADGWTRYLVDLPELPVGYHRLALEVPGRVWSCHLFRAPRRAYANETRPSRTWGLLAPLYALRSEKGWQSGDLTELERLVDLVASSGGGFAATLPLYDGFEEEPSPYSPASRLFWNELYLDPRRTREWARSPRARELASEVATSRDARFVDYDAEHRLRRAVLDELAREAERVRPEELSSFGARHPRAVEYARFRATIEKRGRRPSATWSEADLVPAESPLARRHLYAQLAVRDQLEGLVARALGRGVGLYFDLPLGVHPGSYDVWRFRGHFADGVEVGAPPDPVFTDGQTWGFPPLLPQASRRSGHEYLRLVFAEAMRFASVLRIDHVMGLHRQFWVPGGFERRHGLYVRYPAEELYAVLSIESHRAGTEVAGENLGIVPEVVERGLAEHGLLGLYVLQYALTGRAEAPARPAPARVVASLGTHDTPLFAGFSKGRDIAWREERGLDDAETAKRNREERERQIEALDAQLGAPPGDLEGRLARWLRFLLEGPAELVAITLEDLWLEEEPQNVPGTTAQGYANWRRKLRYGLGEIPERLLQWLRSIDRG